MREFYIFLNRIFNKYKIIIGIIIVIIVLFLLCVKEGTRYTKEQSSSANSTTTIIANEANDSNLTNNTKNKTDEERAEGINSREEAIETFVSFCNSEKIDSAYNMISDDCKEELFPTEDDFITDYYNVYFSEQKQINITQYNNNYIYKVDYKINPIYTGNSDETSSIDYITVNSAYKLSIGGFVDKVEINQSFQNTYLKVEVVSKSIFVNYESYNVKVENLTSANIYLTDSSTDTYIKNENNVCYYLNINEYTEEDLLVKGNSSKEINLKFNKSCNSNEQIDRMIFDSISIENYEYFDKNTISQNIVTDDSQIITYEKKYTTYPKEVSLKISLE